MGTAIAMVVDPPGIAGGRVVALPSRPLSEPPVTIALPSGDYIGVARLVTSGVATRLDLPFEDIDDLQLAVETVLRAVFSSGGEAALDIEADSVLTVAIGPAGAGTLDRRLHEHDASESIDVRGIVERLVDGVSTRMEPFPAIVLRVDLPGR